MAVTKQFKVDEKGGLQNFDDTEEDAISLCDLPLNSKFSDWNEFSDDYQSSSFDSDVFEFFSEDFTSSSKPTDNIIFCGKLIPCKEDPTAVPHHEQRELKNTGKSCILPRRSKTTFSQQNRARSCRGFYNYKTSSIQEAENGGCDSCSNGDKYDSKIKEASIMATPMKSSRWHVLAFGVGRFPTKMGLGDIKNRQSKRNQSTKCDSDQSGAIQNGKSSHEKGAKSLWSLLRMLSLKGQTANRKIMKASVGCLPL